MNNPDKDLMMLMCNSAKINERNGPLKFEQEINSAVGIALACQNYTVRRVEFK